MIHSLSRDLAAARLELGTPTHEEGVTTFSRVIVSPKNDVLLKGTSEGVRDANGKNPFIPRRPVVLIDNENSITLTNEQSGALVIASGLAITGNVILPASPEDGTYFTIATSKVGDIVISRNSQPITGLDGSVSDVPETTLTTGSVTLIWSEVMNTWHIAHVNGTYTISSGA